MLHRAFARYRLPSPDVIYVLTGVKDFMSAVHLAHYEATDEKIKNNPIPPEGIEVFCSSKKDGDGGYPQFTTIPFNEEDPVIVYSMNWKALGNLKEIGIENAETVSPQKGQNYLITDIELFKKMASEIVDELQNKQVEAEELKGMVVTCCGQNALGNLTFQPTFGVSNQDIKISTKFRPIAPLKQCGLAPYIDPIDIELGIKQKEHQVSAP